ncbi:hypothetical protein [Usitatibacter palustris]|uniref:Tissue inhibitor of metalloproteinase n=1 Tax=Usitatibacter palustris TaxID=2732487 RepID=A0A6M4H610_9PROT|nr:hypothetical protein [Usitatibacter palustris]QJR14940.1 hypothetical protein DSM104440_01755 [Usitatibacter palustris]
MKKILCIALPAFALLMPAGANAAACFTVSGNKVTVHGLFKDKSTTVDLYEERDMSAVVSEGSEKYTLFFMMINRDAEKKNVKSFKALVKGQERDYAYPKDACK